MYRVSSFLGRFGWSLLAGAAVATLWVNLSPASYYDVIEARLPELPLWPGPDAPGLSLLRLTADLLMPLFLFVVAKELWEALTLERGALRGPRSALPLMALAGAVLGAVGVWLLAAAVFQTAEEAQPGAGWPVPVGSDVVLAWLVGRAVFGRGHPALHVLLLLTVGADVLGLLLLGLATHGSGLRLIWLVLPLAASVSVWRLYGHHAQDATERGRRRAVQLWPYVVAGGVSWLGVAAAGLPPALGLLPILPAVAHADRSFGLFAEAEEFLTDPLNRLAHLIDRVLPPVLFLFGLTRGGIDLGALAPTTGIVLASLWIGKPLGLLMGGWLAARLFGHRLPPGVRRRDMILVALIAAMGFTVPALALEHSLPGGAVQEAARLGLALSLLAGPAALLAARLRRGRA